MAPQAAELADRIARDAPSPIDYGETAPPAHVTEEDREIIAYRLRIPRDRMRIVPLPQTFR
ncbi:hypothetical protein D3C83_179240 [compost metagenome]